MGDILCKEYSNLIVNNIFFVEKDQSNIYPPILLRATPKRISHEKTQSNRVSDFRDFVCSLFSKAILFDLCYFHSLKSRSCRRPANGRSLDHFYFVNISLCNGAPNTGGVFYFCGPCYDMFQCVLLFLFIYLFYVMSQAMEVDTYVINGMVRFHPETFMQI